MSVEQYTHRGLEPSIWWKLAKVFSILLQAGFIILKVQKVAAGPEIMSRSKPHEPGLYLGTSIRTTITSTLQRYVMASINPSIMILSNWSPRPHAKVRMVQEANLSLPARKATTKGVFGILGKPRFQLARSTALFHTSPNRCKRATLASTQFPLERRACSRMLLFHVAESGTPAMLWIRAYSRLASWLEGRPSNFNMSTQEFGSNSIPC